MGVKIREQLDSFFDLQLVGQGGRLQHCADFLFECRAASFWVEAADARRAAVGSAHALENFDGRGLSGAVGAEQTKNFTLFDGETQTADRLHRAVTFI